MADTTGTGVLDEDLSPAEASAFAPEPAVASGTLVGYRRVSPAPQDLDGHHRALAASGCTEVFCHTGSGRDADRVELAACRAYLRPGGTLVVPSLARLSPSLPGLRPSIRGDRTAAADERA